MQQWKERRAEAPAKESVVPGGQAGRQQLASCSRLRRQHVHLLHECTCARTERPAGPNGTVAVPRGQNRMAEGWEERAPSAF